EEWAEVYNILAQAQKIALFPTWRAEEQQLAVFLGPRAFWISLRQPIEGAWPPAPRDQVPWIDPELLKLNELPEPAAGRQAIALWQMRRHRLNEILKELKETHKQTQLAGLDAFISLVLHAIGDPNPGDPLPDNLNLATLSNTLNSLAPEEIAAAMATIQQ